MSVHKAAAGTVGVPSALGIGTRSARATLRVLDAGLQTLVVDFGRPHCRSLGVPVGGAADRTALALGNALVGNEPNTAALEFSLAGPTLQTDEAIGCVVFGAPFHMTRNGEPVSVGKTFTLRPREILHIGGTSAGVRGYLCVRGGLHTPQILDSHSGLEPVKAGAEFACASHRIGGRFLSPASSRHERLPGTKVLDRFDFLSQEIQTLNALPGLQADWFDGNEFFDQERTVSPASNRMGLRLQGRPLTMPQRELLSEPVCPGTVQVTRDGQCIVLGVDGQTIGGYPKIAQVIHADLDVLGQLRPGTRVRFRMVSQQEAQQRRRAQEHDLSQWILRLRVSSEANG
jgi:biotin-dependent carboxylase-like uncharacterized protein